MDPVGEVGLVPVDGSGIPQVEALAVADRDRPERLIWRSSVPFVGGLAVSSPGWRVQIGSC